MTIKIQKLSKKDLQSYVKYEADMRKDFPKFSFMGLRDSCEYEYFVILYDDFFLGFFTIYQKKRLQTFFIMPLFRSIGLGSVLIDLMKESYPDLYFFVKMQNTEGIKFYEKNGFRIKARMHQWKIVRMGI